jgi:hypothetical protein
MDSDMSECPKVKFRVSGEKSGHSLEDDESVRRSTKKKKDSHLLLDSEMETDLESSMGGEKLDGKESDSPVGVRVGVSYKESLLGEIPGAYERAFFGNSMEEDGEVYSDDEDGDPPEEGEVVIKFSKELKQRIRAPWNTSLIVKVFGRSVGYMFLVNKLKNLWRMVGNFACVDLGLGFFLVRFNSCDGFEHVLKAGPWFVGDYFLSLRPWVPDLELQKLLSPP